MKLKRIAQVGFEPTASLSLNQGGLPIAYRANVRVCPEQESNLQTRGFKPSRSADWRIRARVVPDGLEPPLPGCRPGVVAAGPRDYEVDSSGVAPELPTCEAGVFLLDDKPICEAEAVRLELTSGCSPPPVFKTGSSSGRMTSVSRLRGLESNQHQDVQSVLSYR